MEAVLQRIKDSGDASLGLLSADNYLGWFSLEDEHRDIKVNGETRIPSGRYQLEAIYDSPMAKRYKDRFGHPFLIGIKDVPGFSYIRMHCGNTDDHTEGCVLVGFGGNLKGDPTIQQSGDGYCDWFEHVKDDVEAGEAWLTVLDEPQ